MKSFIALFCLIALVSADGDHAHAHEPAEEAVPLAEAPQAASHAPFTNFAPVHGVAPLRFAPAPFRQAVFAPAPAFAPAFAPSPAFAPAPVFAQAPLLARPPVFAPAPVRVAPVFAPAPIRVAPAPVVVAAPAPAYGPAPIAEINDPPAYDFGYAVQTDSAHGAANFGHNENRNGYSTNGEYRVELPDGRTQIVTYNVGDANTGYVADVRYEGQAIAYAAPAYAAPARNAYGQIIA